jgi:hypothetical protein
MKSQTTVDKKEWLYIFSVHVVACLEISLLRQFSSIGVRISTAFDILHNL